MFLLRPIACQYYNLHNYLAGYFIKQKGVGAFMRKLWQVFFLSCLVFPALALFPLAVTAQETTYTPKPTSPKAWKKESALIITIQVPHLRLQSISGSLILTLYPLPRVTRKTFFPTVTPSLTTASAKTALRKVLFCSQCRRAIILTSLFQKEI